MIVDIRNLILRSSQHSVRITNCRLFHGIILLATKQTQLKTKHQLNKNYELKLRFQIDFI